MFSYPLTRTNRLTLARAFATVPAVDISMSCVIEDQMGEAWVDSLENPQFFRVEQDHFFCYFAGNFDTEAGRNFLSQTPGGRMLMAGSNGWAAPAESVFGERLIPITRYQYSSMALSVEHLQTLAAQNTHTPEVKRVDAALASLQSPYLEIGAFDSPEDFFQRGVGFCLMKADKIIGGAYASLVCSNAIEVSIVVDPDYRRQGVATALSCQLLFWCLNHHLAPHWDAANEESCSLAEKLGYQNKQAYRAYFLK